MRDSITPQNNRLHRIFEAFAALGVSAEPAVYADDMREEVREQLLRCDGVVVWVDPIAVGGDRSQLDPMLREVAAAGVWVSTHPDVILKMGVKEVLVRTRELGWGSDTHLYDTVEQFRERFPARLAAAGPRVLKQNRGNGGIGVWKVELAERGSNARPDSIVRALHAFRGSVEKELPLGEFMQKCEVFFAGVGRIIDQAFQPRLPEGMIRCYLTHDRVVGFGQQLVRALMPAPPADAGPEAAEPGPRVMYGAAEAAFQALRAKLETEWVPGLQRILDIETHALPVIWDADFLLGPRTAAGADTYVLCEINVSAVFPIPDEAPAELARAALARVVAAKAARHRVS